MRTTTTTDLPPLPVWFRFCEVSDPTSAYYGCRGTVNTDHDYLRRHTPDAVTVRLAGERRLRVFRAWQLRDAE